MNAAEWQNIAGSKKIFNAGALLLRRKTGQFAVANIMSLRFGRANLRCMHIFRTFCLARSVDVSKLLHNFQHLFCLRLSIKVRKFQKEIVVSSIFAKKIDKFFYLISKG